MHDEAKIVAVDRTDNAAVVEFAREKKPAVFPARLLHAAKDIAESMTARDHKAEDDAKRRKEQTDKGPALVR